MLTNANIFSHNVGMMRTRNNVRLMLVYDDPDFQEEANAIRDEFVLQLKSNDRKPSYISNVEEGYIRSSGLNDFADKHLIARYGALRKKYELTSAEFVNYFTRNEVLEDDGETEIQLDVPFVINMPSLDDKYLSISISPSATLEDFSKNWNAIEESLRYHFPESAKRKRGPANLDLLWAIHKAKLKGLKNRDIAELLSSGRLGRYHRKKGERKEWSEAAVKQYYYDNKSWVVKQDS